MIYARISNYQALRHPWKQSGMPELAVFKIVKKCNLSIFLQLALIMKKKKPYTLFEYLIATPLIN